MDRRERLHLLRLNVTVLRAALRTRGFWRGAFAMLAGVMAAQVVVWELDLGGWRRDGLLCLPILSGWVLAEVGWRRLRSGLAPLPHNTL